jgi:hypothetical protein
VATDTHRHLGRSRESSDLDGYESPDEYAGQEETRTVKDLMFTYHVLAPSPMISGEEIIKEKVAKQGETIYLDELGTLYLYRGETLGSFYTDAELEAIAAGKPIGSALPPEQAAIMPAEGEGIAEEVVFAELGSHEMVEYLEEHSPNVDDTLALVGNDAEAARRLLEAENIVTGDDPRAGVVKGVERIAANQ